MKKLLLVNDVAGYGKVGMGAMLPVLSYLGLPAFNLPTMLVSNTLDYGDFASLDTTAYMRQVLPVWQKLGFHFDAICTGLMFSVEQAQLVADLCRRQRAEGGTVFVDPVMADEGKLYNGVSLTQVALMKDMVAVADLTFPNWTEACFLTGRTYQPWGMTGAEAEALVDDIVKMGARSVVVTSALIDGRHAVCGFDHKSGTHFTLEYEKLPGEFHGTGDIFSAVLIGHLMKGEPLVDCTQTAMNVVSRMIARNSGVEDPQCGIFIERCLDVL